MNKSILRTSKNIFMLFAATVSGYDTGEGIAKLGS